MAKGAAKKAAAAQSAAATTYQPWILGIDLIHLTLKYLVSSFTKMDLFCLLAIYSMQYYAYLGILEKSTHTTDNKDKALAGGVYLDVLGLLFLVQVVSLLWSRYVYWLLLVLPIWGGYSLYRTFVPSRGATPQPQAASETAMDPQTTAKREKRAEKRRQKWT